MGLVGVWVGVEEGGDRMVVVVLEDEGGGQHQGRAACVCVCARVCVRMRVCVCVCCVRLCLWGPRGGTHVLVRIRGCEHACELQEA